LELPVLLSLGALLSESLSTRRDSVRAPDRLCLDEDRLEPEDRLREPERDEDDRVFDFLEEFPPERLLLLDRDFCRGILPTLLKLRNGVRALPESFRSNLGQVPFKFAAQRVSPIGPPVRKGAAGTEAK
jgi:hypothetical protein